MAGLLSRGQLIYQNENLEVLQRTTDRKTNVSKTTGKKGGLGSRRALTDITNKSTLRPEVSLQKNNVPKEEVNLAEERFLHDHKKCIEAQKIATSTSYLDMVLPGHASKGTLDSPEHNQEKPNLDSFHCYPEPVEMPMSEFSDWFIPSTGEDSPLRSPRDWDSPSESPFAWKYDDVLFVLKEEEDLLE